MLKVCVTLALLMHVAPAHAFLDAIADTAKDAAEAAAVSGAVTELIGELDEDSSPADGNKEVQAANESLQEEVRQAKYLDRETREIMGGPDLTGKRLSANIRFTSQFVKRTKKLLTTVGILSPEASTAVNTAQTSAQMNEMLQNQQTMMLMQQQQIIEQKKKELAEKKSWETFIANQRAARKSEGKK